MSFKSRGLVPPTAIPLPSTLDSKRLSGQWIASLTTSPNNAISRSGLVQRGARPRCVDHRDDHGRCHQLHPYNESRVLTHTKRWLLVRMYDLDLRSFASTRKPCHGKSSRGPLQPATTDSYGRRINIAWTTYMIAETGKKSTKVLRGSSMNLREPRWIVGALTQAVRTSIHGDATSSYDWTPTSIPRPFPCRPFHVKVKVHVQSEPAQQSKRTSRPIMLLSTTRSSPSYPTEGEDLEFSLCMDDIRRIRRRHSPLHLRRSLRVLR